MSKNSIKTVPMTIFDSANMTTSYKPMIPGGLAKACYLLRITNNCQDDITISFDGTSDSEFIFTSTANNIPATYGAQPNGYTAQFPQGQQIYVKSIAASTGNIYISGYYQPQGV